MAYIEKNNGKASTRVTEWKIKEQMCDVGRRIWQRGYCAGNEGNHSYRLSESRVICTPSGVSKGSMKPDDLCVVDLEGKQVGGSRKRTSEIQLHLAIYNARPDVHAVVHAHPPHATAFAIAGVELPTCIHPEAEVFLGPVRTAKYVTPGDKRLGESIAPFVKESNTIVLANHGVVCFGPDLEDAYYKLEILDSYARLLILARQIGSIRPLDAGQMKELLAAKANYGMTDPRVEAGLEKLTCQTDFLSSVCDEGAARGKTATADGSTQPSLQRSIERLAPEHLTEAEIEQLVQTITDQIVASIS